MSYTPHNKINSSGSTVGRLVPNSNSVIASQSSTISGEFKNSSVFTSDYSSIYREGFLVNMVSDDLYVFELISYGDGWSGSTVGYDVDGGGFIDYTLIGGQTYFLQTLQLNAGSILTIQYTSSGIDENLKRWRLYDPYGLLLYDSGTPPETGIVYSTTVDGSPSIGSFGKNSIMSSSRSLIKKNGYYPLGIIEGTSILSSSGGTMNHATRYTSVIASQNTETFTGQSVFTTFCSVVASRETKMGGHMNSIIASYESTVFPVGTSDINNIIVGSQYSNVSGASQTGIYGSLSSRTEVASIFLMRNSSVQGSHSSYLKNFSTSYLFGRTEMNHIIGSDECNITVARESSIINSESSSIGWNTEGSFAYTKSGGSTKFGMNLVLGSENSNITAHLADFLGGSVSSSILSSSGSLLYGKNYCSSIISSRNSTMYEFGSSDISLYNTIQSSTECQVTGGSVIRSSIIASDDCIISGTAGAAIIACSAIIATENYKLYTNAIDVQTIADLKPLASLPTAREGRMFYSAGTGLYIATGNTASDWKKVNLS